jgi:glycosyltransferase involved in cell wall biosynthesis
MRWPNNGRPRERTAGSVALAHDYLLVMRGAERTFAAMADCWPEAPIYTLLYDPLGTDGSFSGRDVRTSYLQRTGVGQHGFRRLLPLLPHAMRSMRLEDHEIVVSSSSAFAHAISVPEGCRHVCYCHSPFRYAWFEAQRAAAETPAPLRPAVKRVLRKIRAIDRQASRRVDTYIANSELTKRRMRDFWGRDAVVVHPPVALERFWPGEPDDHFLIVTELVRHKRVELALEAAARAHARVLVVGDGPDRARLEARFGGRDGTARFLGRVDDDELASFYRSAKALLLPNVEEFGIAAVEAQASGRPVVAVAEGGALETVRDGETGVLVSNDLVAFAEALSHTDFSAFDPNRIAAHAAQFSVSAFQDRLRTAVASSA